MDKLEIELGNRIKDSMVRSEVPDDMVFIKLPKARSVMLIDPCILESSSNVENECENKDTNNYNKYLIEHDNENENENENESSNSMGNKFASNITENISINRGKSCPIPASPRGIPRFPFNLSSHSRDRDTLGIASFGGVRSMLTSLNSIPVNDETLNFAINIQNGKLLHMELEKSVRNLVEKIVKEKKEEICNNLKT